MTLEIMSPRLMRHPGAESVGSGQRTAAPGNAAGACEEPVGELPSGDGVWFTRLKSTVATCMPWDEA